MFLVAVSSSTSGDLTRQPAGAVHELPTVSRGSLRASGHWVEQDSMRRSVNAKALLKKKRVVKMLFAVVSEFFICWTPLYVINTVNL